MHLLTGDGSDPFIIASALGTRSSYNLEYYRDMLVIEGKKVSCTLDSKINSLFCVDPNYCRAVVKEVGIDEELAPKRPLIALTRR